MFDCHVHTGVSADSKMTIEEVGAAIREKEIGVIITEHMDYDFPGDTPFEFDVEDYFKAYGNYRSDKLLLGIELGLQPQVASKNKEILEYGEFDFVLGSIHIVGGIDLYNPACYKGLTKQMAYEAYFKCMVENIRHCPGMDSLGHMDYIARYSPYESSEITYDSFREGINSVLKELVTKDIAMEINTRRLGVPGMLENYSEILRQYKALGGHYVTCGSDAHEKSHIGSSLKDAYHLAESLALKPVYFKKRQMQYCQF